MRKVLSALMLSFILSVPAYARLEVVVTLPWIGSLAREIGGDKIDVKVLVRPDEDPHMVEARPSMILAGRKADMFMYNGLDLEVGYMPQIIESSKNYKILPGKPGNFDCSRFVNAIERPTTVDRSMGDIHPLGNPHYHYSPSNVLKVAEGMSNALAQLDPANVEYYRDNFKNFSTMLERYKKEWDALPIKGKTYVAYHKLFEYLAAEFDLKIIGYMEPKPGIPPSAAYIKQLVELMKSNRPDGILTTSYYGEKEANVLSGETGVRVIILPNDVGAMSGTDDWFTFMERVLISLK